MRHAIRLACCAVAVLLCACAALWSAPQPSATAKTDAAGPHPVARLAQLGHGRAAAFALCDSDTCPHVTPKTFGARGAAAAPAPEGAPRGPAAPPPAVGTAPSVPAPPPEAAAFSVTVFFRFGEAVLTPLAKDVLDAAVARAGHPQRLRIVGRTDSVGAPAVNDALAKERTQAVRDHLRARLPHWPATVDVESAGACCFAASNATAQGRQANRRVEVTFSVAAPEDLL